MQAFIRGNLGSTPELRHLNSGLAATQLRVAVSQTATEREHNDPTVWVDVQVLGELAERCAATFSTGDPVLVLGYWKADEWTKDGEKRRKTYVFATAAGPDLSRCSVAGVARATKETDAPPAATAAVDPFEE